MEPTFLPRPYKSCPKDDGDSKLHQACYNGAYESVLMLILSGEDVMSRNVWNHTPLHHCTSQGHLDVMMLLLDSGASVNALDHENLTPLHQAVIHGNKHAAELLLCYGASVHNHITVRDGSRSVLQLASHVHVCHKVIEAADGHIWPLQHLCRIATRRSLGAARRKRIKELPIPKHLVSYLCCLPVAKSDLLHQNWERIRSNKCEAIRKKGVSRRLHQRLGMESLSISSGQGLSEGRGSGRNGDSRSAQELHQEFDDADGNTATSSSSADSDSTDDQSHRDIASAGTDDGKTQEEKSEEGRFVRPTGKERESVANSSCDIDDTIASSKERADEDAFYNGTPTATLHAGGANEQHHHLTMGENGHNQTDETENYDRNQDKEIYEGT